MGDMPVWKGLFEWSMRYQDGSGGPSSQRALPEEERRWLETALKSYMVDLGKRMKDIKESLDGDEARPATVEEKEQLLEELMDLVEGIDQAKDLHTIGGLPTLLDLLRSEHPSLRWRAAEVVATCVQNNPPVQQWFLEGGALPLLEGLLSDADSTCQTKALLAVSCLVRGYHPALLAFRNHGGIGTLCTLLQGSDCVRLQRKCLQLLQYTVRTIPGDRMAVAQGGAVSGVRGALAGDDNDLRQAAAMLANELAGDDAVLALMQQDEALRQEVQRLQMRLDTMPEEDWDMVQEEVAALKLLTQQLDRQLPPSAPQDAAAAPATGPASQTVVLVDNPDTSGAPPAQLQLATLPASE